MTKLIILMAPPGAGKTELAKYLNSKIDNSIIINKNVFVKSFKDSINSKYFASLNHALKKYDCVILDSHSVLYQDRLDLFKHIPVNELNIIGVWIETNYKDAVTRNLQKPKGAQSSQQDLDFLFKYRISPVEHEPFDDIVYIMRDADIGMSKNQPYMTNTLGALDRIIDEN